MATKPPGKTIPTKPGCVNFHQKSEDQRDVINRLRRIEGQARGLIEMIQQDRPCEDVALQMAAMRKAMDKTFYHMMSCTVIQAVNEADSNATAITQVRHAAQLLAKFG